MARTAMKPTTKTATKRRKKITGDESQNKPLPTTIESSDKSRSPHKSPRALTLVTGGTGFLGSHLIHQLINSGERNIRVLTTSIATSRPQWLTDSGIEVIEGSITSPEVASRAVAGVTNIYHLAGRVSRLKDDAHELYDLHIKGTRILLEAALAAGTRTVVMASTSGTIAVTETGDAIPDELWSTPIDLIARWPYYSSKLYQERTALEIFREKAPKGARLVIMNPSLLLGPRDDRLSSTRVVLDFLGHRIFSVPSGGLSFLDVRDAASAFQAAMEQGGHGERYLLGAANWTFKEFFNRLARLSKVAAPQIYLPRKFAIAGAGLIDSLFKQWEKRPPLKAEEIEMAEHFWYLNSSKAVAELGFSPRDPHETLHQTVQYVRENFTNHPAFARS